MHNRKLAHVVECLQDLDGEALGKSHGKALKIIVFDELVQVDAQHLKDYAHMTSERKVVFYSHNVLCVFVVLVAQVLKYLYFNLALFVQFLPVFKHLDSHCLVRLVVETFYHHAERSSTQFLLHFVTKVYMVFRFVQVVCFIIIKPKVINT